MINNWIIGDARHCELGGLFDQSGDVGCRQFALVDQGGGNGTDGGPIDLHNSISTPPRESSGLGVDTQQVLVIANTRAMQAVPATVAKIEALSPNPLSSTCMRTGIVPACNCSGR